MSTKQKTNVFKPLDSNSAIPELLKVFLEGGLNTVINTKHKGLSNEFQQNAINMSEVILKHGTITELQTLLEIYHSCLKRAI